MEPERGRLGWRLNEIADALGVSRQFVQREEKAGRLKARRIAGAVIVLTKDLDAWLEGPDRPRRAERGGDVQVDAQ
jgi:transcriptional regulator with XRE-family HTH domain